MIYQLFLGFLCFFIIGFIRKYDNLSLLNFNKTILYKSLWILSGGFLIALTGYILGQYEVGFILSMAFVILHQINLVIQHTIDIMRRKHG